LPYALVVTSYAGATPEQVESEVSRPVEQTMATLDGIASVRSTSSENVSMVILEFESGTDMDIATVNIREKLDMIRGSWDAMVGTPFILKLNPDMLPVTVAAVDRGDMSTLELSAFVADTLQPKLEGVEGVASVSLSGTVEQTVNVAINEEKLAAVNERVSEAVLDSFSGASGKLWSGISQANSGISSLDSAKTSIADAQTQLATQTEAARLTLGKNRALLVSLKDPSLQATLTGLNTNISSIEAARAAALAADPNADVSAYDAQLSAIDAALSGYGITRSQLPSLVASFATLDAQIAAVDDALSQLNIQSQVASAQLGNKMTEATVGAATLSTTVSSLRSALEQVQSAKEAALRSADLTGILTMDNLSAILTAQNFSMPAGYITEENTRYLVRVAGGIDDLDALRDLVVLDLGLDGLDAIRLSDVADVYVSDNAAEVYAKINGSDGVLLSFSKQSGYATADVADRISAEFDALSAQYDGLHFSTLMDQGEYIHLVVDSVLENLLIGALLAILILFLFLRDLRPTFITACSIPISVTFAIVLMYFSGVTLNIISLAGLAVGVGMLVDNSIVVIENIYRLRSMGLSAGKAAISGAAQVTAAITASTLTTVCVFFPIVFVEGLTKQLFTDMALTIAYSLLSSLIVALTLVPAMARGILVKKAAAEEPKFYQKLLRKYRSLVEKALDRKALILVGSLVLLLGSAAWALSRGFQYMPDMASNQIMAELTLPQDNTLADTAAVCDEIAEKVGALDGVDTVGTMLAGGISSVVGLGSSADADPSSVTMYVIAGGDAKKTARAVSDLLAQYPDVESTVSGSSQMTNYASALGGSGVTIDLYGDDLDDLRDAARGVASTLRTVDGIAEVDDGIGDTTPELRVVVDKTAAMKHGLTVAQVYAQLAASLTQSKTPTSLVYAGEEREIVISPDAGSALTRAALLDTTFTVKDSAGEESEVPLSDFAKIEQTESMDSISRSGQRRTLTVSGTLADGYNVTLVTSAAQKALADTALPQGVALEYSGENETILSSMKDLLLMLLLGIVIVYLIMVAQFQSLVSPFIVMFTIPLAFTGGLIALILCGMEVSIVAMIGFVMLVGIIVNNGIVLIDYINRLMTEGRDKRTAILEAGATRLRPVLMTALTTILGLVPLALGLGLGADLIQPVAVVCIGGLVYATLMTLFVVPVMYDLLIHHAPHSLTEEELEISDL
ncbi:MAG: efflux RND transporter permease subunit, partial [Oscillospiraceae bacterium]|nr:efflux RND transporter permease subunit [Oscillospiraceae bacterium]